MRPLVVPLVLVVFAVWVLVVPGAVLLCVAFRRARRESADEPSPIPVVSVAPTRTVLRVLTR